MKLTLALLLLGLALCLTGTPARASQTRNTMPAYYNEFEPFAAQWLRNLITANLIAPGEVDERSIALVQPEDVRDFDQCHFFAGLGGWSYALRCAGWPDERECWTGSAPCQPFSVAGKGEGIDDKRHLWPEFFRLIRECRPDVVLGEQVSSPQGLGWFDAVSADLESAGYAAGALDTCAAWAGAPHLRHRLYWMGHADSARWELAGQAQPSERTADLVTAWSSEARRVADSMLARRPQGRTGAGRRQTAGGGAVGGMGNANGSGSGRDSGAVLGTKAEGEGQRREARGVADQSFDAGPDSRLANSNGGQSSDGELQRGRRLVQLSENPLAGFWRDSDWLLCTDGKARPVEPGTQPLATGATKRLGRLRGYGNALCAPQAQAFVEAVMECIP